MTCLNDTSVNRHDKTPCSDWICHKGSSLKAVFFNRHIATQLWVCCGAASKKKKGGECFGVRVLTICKQPYLSDRYNLRLDSTYWLPSLPEASRHYLAGSKLYNFWNIGIQLPISNSLAISVLCLSKELCMPNALFFMYCSSGWKGTVC